MEGMTVQQRVSDIAMRSGASAEIVRAVLKAEADSITESLIHGERATLIGRVTLMPSQKYTMIPMVGATGKIVVKAKLAGAIQQRLDEIGEFQQQEENSDGLEQMAEKYPELLTGQIQALLG